MGNLGKKKDNLESDTSIETRTTIAVEEVKPIEEKSKFLSNLNLKNYIEKVNSDFKSEDKSKSEIEYKVEQITNNNIWNEIIENIKTTKEHLYLSSLKPLIEFDTLIFNVPNNLHKELLENYSSIIESTYTIIEKKKLNIRINIDNTIIVEKSNETLSKLDKFNILAQKYPIVTVIAKEFNIDMYI